MAGPSPREDAAGARAPSKRPLDTVVKLGLGVFVTSFALIWGGMYLTRPDRSIPPFSVGAQEGTAVAVHVPAWTPDSGIETLIARFRKVAHETGDFGPMKIRPTTPGDPAGRYARLTVYIFTHDAWAEPEMLHRYVAAEGSANKEEREFLEAYEKAVRGLFRLDGDEEEGRIGPIGQPDSPATAAFSRLLFKGPVVRRPAEPSPGG